MKSLTNKASLANLNGEFLNTTLSKALKDAQNYLNILATSPDFVTKIQAAFGNNFDEQKIEELAASWVKGDLGNFSQLEIRDAAEINGARGAFAAATNRIYLSREFLRENEENVEAIASVLLEEYGHYIDSQINAIDSPGDEGEIFSDLIHAKNMTLPEISKLQTEDDSVVLVLDGRVVAIEQAATTTQQDKLDFFAGKIANWGGLGFNRIQADLFNPIKIKAPGGSVDNFLFKFDWDLQSELKGSVFIAPGNYGEANFKYPIDVNVELPQYVELGETFSIITGPGIKNSAAGFTTDTKGVELPNAGFELEANLNKATFKNVTIKNPFGSDFKPDIGIESSEIQAKLSFDVINREFDFLDGIGSFSVSTPKIKDGEIKPVTPRDRSDSFLPDIAASGKSDNFIKLEGDLDKIFALFFPAFKILGNETKNIFPPEARISAKLSYDILDIKANIGLALQQDFTFNPNKVEVTMSVEGQPDRKGVLGDTNNKFEFKAPSQGSGTVKIKAKYELFGTVKNNIGSVIKGGVDVSALQAEGNFDIGLLSSGKLQLGPLLSLKIPENGFATDPLPLIGSPPTKASDPGTKLGDPDPTFELNIISTAEIGGTEQDDKNPQPGAQKNLIIEKEYEIRYNMPVTISDVTVTEGDNPPPGERKAYFKFGGKYYEWETYTVQPGNTLSQIALSRLGSASPDAYKFIAFENNISNPDLIFANTQVIQVPKQVQEPDTKGYAVFNVIQSGTPNAPAKIKFNTPDGTTTASDYISISGNVSVPAGGSAVILVPIVGDARKEETENFKVTLTKQDGTPFAEGVNNIEATGIIIDDDGKPNPPKNGGKTYNDPRIITIDRQYHDFQAVGEFTLVESSSGDLKIQVRQQPIGNDPRSNVSDNTAVATLLGGKRIAIYKDRGLLIDGVPTVIPNDEYLAIGDGRIYREDNIYTIVYPTGDQIVAKVVQGRRVNINVYLTEERKGKIVGLLGNFNRDRKDDLAKRDGTVISQPVPLSQLYGEYADSWRITQAESLLDYQPGEDTNTFTNRNFPRQKVTLKDLNPADIQKAEQAIGNRITDPTIREAAIIDYILTGFDESIIEEAIASPIPESILIIAIPPRAFEDFSATKVNTPVKINVLRNDEGTIGVPLAIANFDSTTTKGNTISIDDNATPDNKNDDRLIYTPSANFTGNDTFNYTVSDGKDSSTAKVTVLVNPPFPPFAAADFSNTAVNNPIKIDVLSNDISIENLPLTIANFDQTSIAGSIIRLDDNNTPDDKTDDQLIYTPTANFTGNDTFNYTVTDGAQTSTAKVTVNIATFNLSNLNGSNGFTLNGINPGNFAGVSVNTLGDFNGDGFHDLIIGGFGADPNNNNAAGETYVVFGKKGGFPASIDLPKLDGSNGFILNGIDTNGFSGGSVSSAGDINGDGLDDLAIGAFGATVNGQNNAGKSYIVFGTKAVLPARLNLSDLNGNNGFVVNGINEFDYLGLAVSGAGDINADGIDDLLMSAPGPLNGTLSKSYLMYGHKGNFAASLNSSDINGSNGFVINDNDGKSGTYVSAAGDINGDRIDDIIINAEENDSNNYVIFGSGNGFSANFNLSELNGSNGFILDTLNEKSGTTVSKAGDINGDTIDDLIISLASSNSNVGKTYIFFGNNREFAPRFDVSQFNGRNGFALINNIDGNSISSVSGAGDINNDGIDDLAIATSQANANAGKTYILFGDNAGFTPTFSLSRINGTNGLVINGVKEDDLSGTSLSQGGDINGDNIDDLVIGSPGNLFNNSPGQTHVVFGSTLFGSSKDTSNLAKLLFDSGYYSNQNPDVRSAVSNGLFHNGFEHFVKFGLTEGREPSATFAGDYLTNNPDVAAAVNTGIFHSGFEHFIKIGLAEGRKPDPLLGSLASLEVFYRSENPDVQAAIQQGILSSGLEHIIRFGMQEGRPPFTRFTALSETFDSDFYLAQNQDVKQAVDSGIFRSALEHFANFGLFEGRNPGSQFSNSSYLANYPDVAGAVSSGILRSGYEHFMKYGFGEERVGVESSFA